MIDRKKKLKRNFPLMFVMKGLMEARFFSAIGSIFYISRGIAISEITLLAVIFAFGGIIFEIPSSYLADRWGRKNTLFVGTLIMLGYWLLLLFGNSFFHFGLAAVLYSVSYSFITGTDQALLYDSSKELGEGDDSLVRLSKLFSARPLLRSIAIVFGALIANNLTQESFILVISLDLILNLLTLFVITLMVEADHKIDLEKQEAGVFLDAFDLFRKNPHLTFGIISKSIPFVAGLMLFQYHQVFFVSLGLSILTISLIHFVRYLTEFYFNNKLHSLFSKYSLSWRISILHLVQVLMLMLFLIDYYFFKNSISLIVLYDVLFVIFAIQAPLFAEYFNRHSHSFNRATTLSLANFMNSALQIPILSLAALFVSMNQIYPYWLALMLCFLTLFIKLPRENGFFKKNNGIK